jgi:Domain of unknown function (DUF4328)
MTEEIWACGACRSINNVKAKRCYKCLTPRDVARVDPATMPIGASQPGPALALPAFRSTRGLALIASILVLAVAALRILALIAAAPLLQDIARGTDVTEADLVAAAGVSLASTLVQIVALLVWAFWLSRVVTVMPALGLGYPHSSGMTAFVECIIPIFNFFRVPAILRDVTRRIAPTDSRGNTLIAAAWIGLIGSFLLDFFGGFVIGFRATDQAQAINDSLVLSAICAAIAVIGAGFGVYLTLWIEAGISRVHHTLDSEGGAASATAAPSMPVEILAPAPEPAPVAEPFILATPVAAPVAASVVATRAAFDGTEPAASNVNGDGPHMRVRISGDTIEASLDGSEWEDVSLAELGEAAVAIQNASGITTLIAGQDVVAAGLGRDAIDALRASGATYSMTAG